VNIFGLISAMLLKKLVTKIAPVWSVRGIEDSAQPPEMSSREEVTRYLSLLGFKPSDFVFSYVPERASEDREAVSRRCRFEDLPENLDCFLCRAIDGSMMFDYCRYQSPQFQITGACQVHRGSTANLLQAAKHIG
jgi:hypothetical protein